MKQQLLVLLHFPLLLRHGSSLASPSPSLEIAANISSSSSPFPVDNETSHRPTDEISKRASSSIVRSKDVLHRCPSRHSQWVRRRLLGFFYCKHASKTPHRWDPTLSTFIVFELDISGITAQLSRPLLPSPSQPRASWASPHPPYCRQVLTSFSNESPTTRDPILLAAPFVATTVGDLSSHCRRRPSSP